jgi:hypothetical protein
MPPPAQPLHKLPHGYGELVHIHFPAHPLGEVLVVLLSSCIPDGEQPPTPRRLAPLHLDRR